MARSGMYTLKTVTMTEQKSNQGSLTGNKKLTGTKVRGTWDTGTSTTVITPAVAAKLNLKPVGNINLNGLGGRQMSWLTIAWLRFPNGIVLGPLYMAVQDLPSTDVLIGMDVISMGRFLLERKPDGGTRFTFTL